MENKTITEYKKLTDGKIEFKYTQNDIPFKFKEENIGFSKHIQTTIVNSKELALEFLNEQLEAASSTTMKIQTEFDKNNLDMGTFKEIGEYLSNNSKKVPLKKLTRLNELYKKYENKTKLEKELELYKTQKDKIQEQVSEVEKL